jgi:hypothetical protein
MTSAPLPPLTKMYALHTLDAHGHDQTADLATPRSGMLDGRAARRTRLLMKLLTH